MTMIWYIDSKTFDSCTSVKNPLQIYQSNTLLLHKFTYTYTYNRKLKEIAIDRWDESSVIQYKSDASTFLSTIWDLPMEWLRASHSLNPIWQLHTIEVNERQTCLWIQATEYFIICGYSLNNGTYYHWSTCGRLKFSPIIESPLSISHR